MQSPSCKILNKSQAGIKIAKGNINNLRYAEETTLMDEKEEEPKSLLMKVKESEKAGLNLNIQKTKIMASSSILHGKQVGKNGNIGRFIFLVSKITVDSDCSHEIKRHMILGRKTMTKLDSALKAETFLCWQGSL